MRHGTRGDQVEIGSQVEKKEARKKNGRKRAEKIFALYAPFPYYCRTHSLLSSSFLSESPSWFVSHSSIPWTYLLPGCDDTWVPSKSWIDHVAQASLRDFAIEHSEELVLSCLTSLFHRVHELRQRTTSRLTEFMSIPLILEISLVPCLASHNQILKLSFRITNLFTRSCMFCFLTAFIDLVFSSHTLFNTYACESGMSYLVNCPSIILYLATNRFQVWVPILIIRPVSGLIVYSSRWVSIKI